MAAASELIASRSSSGILDFADILAPVISNKKIHSLVITKKEGAHYSAPLSAEKEAVRPEIRRRTATRIESAAVSRRSRKFCRKRRDFRRQSRQDSRSWRGSRC